MNYEVIQADDEWVVFEDGIELARFYRQSEALDDVGRRLRTADADDAASLAVRYQPPPEL